MKIFWLTAFYTKLLLGQKHCVLGIRLDKVDGFIGVYDGTRHLVLFGPEKYDVIYNTIWYLISQKSGIPFVISHNYTRIKTDSYDSLSLQKSLNLNNVLILIKSVF